MNITRISQLIADMLLEIDHNPGIKRLDVKHDECNISVYAVGNNIIRIDIKYDKQES